MCFKCIKIIILNFEYFCCSGPNPTDQKQKNLDPTQPMCQPNPWTILRGYRGITVVPITAHGGPIFTARCYASAVLAMALCLSVCPSVCSSVTSRCSTKTAKGRITQITPHDSPGTLVFRYQRSPRNSTGVTPYEGAECRWGGSKSATSDQ